MRVGTENRHWPQDEERLMFAKLRDWARRIKRDVQALWLAARDPRTPWYAKAAAASVAAYALSPIDLIPDFIPVLGYLDDVIIVPLGILLTIKLVPETLMTEFRKEALRLEGWPKSYAAAAAIIFVWLAAFAPVVWWVWR
jgi:uncharacterized membrane protein YkvA (DUF1232 family)